MIEVLKFSAKWCAPCKTLSETLKNVKEIINIDIDDSPHLATKYGIRNIPTIIFKVEGKVVHRESGILTESNYNKIIEEITNSKELWNNN